MIRKQFYLLGGAVLLLAILVFFKYDRSQPEQKMDLSAEKIPTLQDWRKKYPGIKSLVFEANPQELPANFPHPGRTTQEYFSYPEDGWSIGFVPEQIGASHALHHADIIDPSRPNFFCTAGVPNVLTATGDELTSGFMPLGYGYPIKKGSKLMVSLMYHNENAEPLSGVHAKLTFYYLPKSKGSLTDTVPLFFDVVGPCLWGEYTIPPNSSHVKKMEPEYVVQKPGRVILMGHHMHRYAKSLEFLINGKVVKSFQVPKSDEGERLIFPKYLPKNLRLNVGDRVGMRATYDNTTSYPLEAMAEVLFFLVPDKK